MNKLILEQETKKFEPVVETTMKLSNNGKFLIHITTIKDIKPMTYLKKVIDGGGQ